MKTAKIIILFLLLGNFATAQKITINSPLMHNPKNGRISLYMDGSIRNFTSMNAFYAFYQGDINGLGTTKYEDDSKLPCAFGENIVDGYGLYQYQSDIYMLDQQAGKQVYRKMDAATFTYFGFSKAVVKTISSLDKPLGTAITQGLTITFFPYNPVYQQKDGKSYTITITEKEGKTVYSASGTTDKGIDTYYGTSYGKDIVKLEEGKYYVIKVVANAGGELYESSTNLFVHAKMDTNIKILHNAFTKVQGKTFTIFSYNPIYQQKDGKPYSIVITDEAGNTLYSATGTTDKGIDTYYGTSYGKDVVTLPEGKKCFIKITATAGTDVYVAEANIFVHSGADPNFKILHNAYTKK